MKLASQPEHINIGRATAAAMARENPPAPQPWEVQTIVRQAEVRKGYAKAAELLEQSDAPEDLALTRQTRAFVASMPQPLIRDREQAQAIFNKGRPPRSPQNDQREHDGKERSSERAPDKPEKDRER